MDRPMSMFLDDLETFFSEAAKRPEGVVVDAELCASFACALGEARRVVEPSEAYIVSQARLYEMRNVEADGDNVIPFRPRQRPAFCDGRGGGGAA